MTLPDGVEAVRLDSEGFVLAVAQGSWLLGLKAIGCEHLQNETFILPEQISGTLHVAAQGGYAPRLGPQPGGLVAVLALVSLGQGVAVVPASVVGHVTLPNVLYRPIQGSDASSWLSLIHRRFEKATAVNQRAIGTDPLTTSIVSTRRLTYSCPDGGITTPITITYKGTRSAFDDLPVHGNPRV